MKPIKSEYDVRLLTLIGLAVSAFETLALELNVDPDKLLAENLYLVTKKLHEVGEEEIINKFHQQYPLLEEVLN